MHFFSKKREKPVAAAATAQIARAAPLPLGGCVPLRRGDTQLYRAIREAVPVGTRASARSSGCAAA